MLIPLVGLPVSPTVLVSDQFFYVRADVATVEGCTKLAEEADRLMEGIDGLVSVWMCRPLMRCGERHPWVRVESAARAQSGASLDYVVGRDRVFDTTEVHHLVMDTPSPGFLI